MINKLDPEALDAAIRVYHKTYVAPYGPLKAAICAYLAARPGLWFIEKDGSMRAPTTKDV